MRLPCYKLIIFHPHPRQMITGYRTAAISSSLKERTELKADAVRNSTSGDEGSTYQVAKVLM